MLWDFSLRQEQVHFNFRGGGALVLCPFTVIFFSSELVCSSQLQHRTKGLRTTFNRIQKFTATEMTSSIEKLLLMNTSVSAFLKRQLTLFHPKSCFVFP